MRDVDTLEMHSTIDAKKRVCTSPTDSSCVVGLHPKDAIQLFKHVPFDKHPGLPQARPIRHTPHLHPTQCSNKLINNRGPKSYFAILRLRSKLQYTENYDTIIVIPETEKQNLRTIFRNSIFEKPNATFYRGNGKTIGDTYSYQASHSATYL